MPETIEVKITVSGTARPYGAWMNGKPIRITNGKGSVKLSPQPQGQIFIWYAEGSPGDSIKMTAKAGSKKYVEVDRKIPTGQQRIAGTKKFRIS